MDLAGTLYLVPTPIGNLGDISRRMAETLEQADFIAAEDTRVTVKLLNHLGIRRPMLTYHRHNTDSGGQAVIDRLLAGESCALVTDAGTPAISDPGEELVARCAELGVPVCAIPGPCALVTALAVSGQPTGRFTFEGFLAMNKKNRRAHLDALRGEERTMVFYEAPHKLAATLEDLSATFGPDRPLTLCRELTKLHEEVRRTPWDRRPLTFGRTTPRGSSCWWSGGRSRSGRKRPAWRTVWFWWTSCGERACPSGTRCARRPGSWGCPGTSFTTWRLGNKMHPSSKKWIK